MRYKCHLCKIVLEEDDLQDGGCPVCHSSDSLKEMCENDVTHCCSSGIMDGIAYCDICGEPMCKECGCHDVSQVSRVTGYLADVSGFNAGKKQELKDRTRVTLGVSH